MDHTISEETPSDVIESDCCGNGCANCVLYIGYRKSDESNNSGKHNVMSSYRMFQLISRCIHNPKSKNEKRIDDAELSQHVELYFGVCDLLSDPNIFFLDIPVGCHVMMRTKLDTKLDFSLRPYSPYWVDASAMEFKILVNLAANGPMSRNIRGLNVGDVVEFRGPIGTFNLSQHCDKERFIFIITQGVAIAPTIRIVEEILKNEEDLSRIVQLACFKDLDHIFFRGKLIEFNKYWNYKSRIYLAHQRCPSKMCENEECTGKCDWFLDNLFYKEQVLASRLDESELSDLCKDVKDCTELIFIIAGAKKFQEDVAKMTTKMEITELNTKTFLL